MQAIESGEMQDPEVHLLCMLSASIDSVTQRQPLTCWAASILPAISSSPRKLLDPMLVGRCKLQLSLGENGCIQCNQEQRNHYFPRPK